MGFAPEVNDIQLVSHIASLGIVPNIGHTNGTAQDVFDSADLGATGATHT